MIDQKWYEDRDPSIKYQYAQRFGAGAEVSTWNSKPRYGVVTRAVPGTFGQEVWVLWTDATTTLEDLSFLCLRRESPAMPKFAARPCTWLVEELGEDGRFTRECGAPMRFRRDDTGYDCDRGHEHTYAWDRAAQGWDYAEDLDEAKALAKAGVEPRTMDTGQVWPR